MINLNNHDLSFIAYIIVLGNGDHFLLKHELVYNAFTRKSELPFFDYRNLSPGHLLTVLNSHDVIVINHL